MSGANRESADVGGYLGHCLGKWYKIKRMKTQHVHVTIYYCTCIELEDIH